MLARENDNHTWGTGVDSGPFSLPVRGNGIALFLTIRAYRMNHNASPKLLGTRLKK